MLKRRERRYWLIRMRKDLGFTQEQVAKKAGIERSTYTKAENGNPVSVSTAKAIARVLGCDWVRFFEDESDVNLQSNKY